MTHSYFLRVPWKQFYIVNCMIPVNSTWVPSLGDKTHHCQFAGLIFRAEQYPSGSFPQAHPAPVPQSLATGQQAHHWALLPTPLRRHSHCRTAASGACNPFLRWQKGGRRTLFALNGCMLGALKWGRDPSSTHFTIVLLGSLTSVSTENICHSQTVIFKILTFTSSSGTLTCDNK